MKKFEGMVEINEEYMFADRDAYLNLSEIDKQEFINHLIKLMEETWSNSNE